MKLEFKAGWAKENLIDTIVLVGDKTISNYINNTTEIPVDFPVAQPLEVAVVSFNPDYALRLRYEG